ncbi:MAG: hypothetical protein ACK5MR_17610 [Cumulibacter sp.]
MRTQMKYTGTGVANPSHMEILATIAVMDRPSRGYPFALTEDQHARLKADANEAGYTIQAYLEMKVFGEIRQRGSSGPRPIKKPKNQRELPMTG